jgi:2-amino-4-hydroxy-6-hydroxymethyldihydropteridine diphosphokinase/dihydropteroate synthase
MRNRVFLSLGANLGDRKTTLRQAVNSLPLDHKRISPIFETPALLPTLAQDAWNIPFLNLVVEGESEDPAPLLLEKLKRLEAELGRTPSERWAPRVLDIDILLYGTETVTLNDLQIPHPEILKRAFVLDPLSHLAPGLALAGSLSSLQQARKNIQHRPALMGILNMTPDSFSDAGVYKSTGARENIFRDWSESNVSIIDIGAESTRPGAQAISSEQEWHRLEPVLRQARNFFKDDPLRPQISIDTRFSATAARALELGVEFINDVSGLSDPGMIDVLQNSKARYILMHSLSVPVNPKMTLATDLDEVDTVKFWFKNKIETLEASGISRDRLILDPGLGFGKTRSQNLNLLKRIHEFHDLEVPLLAGASRKSFLGVFSQKPVAERDPETLGISLAILNKVELLRVHDPVLHTRAINAYLHARPQ